MIIENYSIEPWGGWRCGGVVAERELFIAHIQPSLALSYSALGFSQLRFSLRLVAYTTLRSSSRQQQSRANYGQIMGKCGNPLEIVLIVPITM